MRSRKPPASVVYAAVGITAVVVLWTAAYIAWPPQYEGAFCGEGPGGVYGEWDQPPGSSDYQLETRRFEVGNVRLFPPARECLVYGDVTYFYPAREPDFRDDELLGSGYTPAALTVALLLGLCISPFIVWLAVTQVRRWRTPPSADAPDT